MRPNAYAIHSRAVEDGVKGGIHKALKRGYIDTNAGDDEALDRERTAATVELVAHYVGIEIAEVFNFDEPEDDVPLKQPSLDFPPERVEGPA